MGQSSLEEVINSMTLEEKVSMVMGTGMNFPGLPPEMDGPVVGQSGEKVAGAAGNTFAILRLGIPVMVLADGPAGLRIQPYREGDSTRTYYCTAFPIATLLASTWDTQLVERVGKAVGNELKEYGVDVLLAPALNIHRNPLGGRNFEYYSEDPLISGKMAAAMVRGVQSQGVGTALKHFAANNHEWNRFTLDVVVSERALREIYLRGFEIAVKEGKPWTIMSSYNKINGTFTSESEELLTDVLRGDWKFDGFVMTDWFGGQNPIAQMIAGNDLLMPGTAIQQEILTAALKSGDLDESVLDRNIGRILKLILKSPAYQNYTYSGEPDLKAHARLSREAASEGMVLLKNESNVLPLKPGSKPALLGNSSYKMIIGGTGSGDVNESYAVSLKEGLNAAGFVTDPELAETYTDYIATEKAALPPLENPFMLPTPISERPLTEAELNRMAEDSDLALVTIGRNSGEFADRELKDDFYLSDREKKMLKDVSRVFHSAGKKVVVVLNIAGVIEIASWRDKADAILLAWQPGQEAGNAITDVLSGKVTPCGKLATTFPMDFDDVPSSSNFPGIVLEGPDPERPPILAAARAAEIIYKDDIWVGYRFFNSQKMKTAYPFGFGLSYTAFEYDQVEVSSTEFRDKLTASVTVTNTGNRSGKEVVQLYLSAPVTDLVKPAAELKGFAKTRLLKPGESETLLFDLKLMDLASFDPSPSAWIAEAGEYIINIGSSSMEIQGRHSFRKAEREVVETVSKSLLSQKKIDKIAVKQ